MLHTCNPRYLERIDVVAQWYNICSASQARWVVQSQHLKKQTKTTCKNSQGDYEGVFVK